MVDSVARMIGNHSHIQANGFFVVLLSLCETTSNSCYKRNVLLSLPMHSF